MQNIILPNSGILIPKYTSLIPFKGLFDAEVWRKGRLILRDKFPNSITNVGAGYILDTMFNNQMQIAQSSWSIGLIDNASFTALALADTMASHSGWIENIAYSESTRVAWGPGNSSARTVTNATAATFDITGTATLQGVFVTSNNTLSGTAGTLWTEALFSSPIPVTSGDSIKISYSVAC
jgi:hypothetical protein